MASLNKVQIIGHLGKDPILRAMPDGKSVVSFSVATSESYKDKNGEQVEKTEWFNIIAFAKLADICAQYLKKGSLVYCEGKFQTRRYEKDGTERFISEVIINEMKMLSGKPSRSDDQGSDAPTPTPKQSKPAKAQPAPSEHDFDDGPPF